MDPVNGLLIQAMIDGHQRHERNRERLARRHPDQFVTTSDRTPTGSGRGPVARYLDDLRRVGRRVAGGWAAA